MLEFDAAQQQLLDAAPAPTTQPQACALRAALGRVLAQDVHAEVALPPADNSAMDGYAVRLADLAAGAGLPVQQRCYAGEMPEPLRAGHAIRLFTGSLIPAGADTVVMQEDCDERDGHVQVREAPTLGQHIRRAGEDIAPGTCIAAAGTRLTAAHVALLATQGHAELVVWPRLRVGILSTGDELVQPGHARALHQLYDSNAPMLAALVEGLGAEVGATRHARDDETALGEAILALARDCDIVLTAGGVSVGEKDLVKPVLESLGGRLALWKVRMKPGKPVALGAVRGTPVVCLPGNPVSAFAVFTVLVSPMLRRMQGRTGVRPPVQHGVLRTATPSSDSRENFLRVRAAADEAGRLVLTPHRGQTSGIMSALPWADGLARIPADATRGDGDVVAYYPLASWLS
ncbi:molybdopterin molybdotransferase MoeA [Verticiella sediminum]|uniref:Molybdopterin molybdenumtransferase n=1 Tax=Verticiella sediminum TaxID=1247510 RepID=A0A556A886_9BURK|nr:gephyrin-like molybdotransferase Glp [Verticiella sediminum]TSH89097.1 molybdopterin molybdotransferase MoeA [Verticiella sediminum]